MYINTRGLSHNGQWHLRTVSFQLSELVDFARLCDKCSMMYKDTDDPNPMVMTIWHHIIPLVTWSGVLRLAWPLPSTKGAY